MKNCIELDAVDKWIDLRLFRLGQSYLSLRGQDNEETSFFCLAPISMTIESKDFFATLTFFLLWESSFYGGQVPTEPSSGIEWTQGTVYNESEILGGYADEI